MTGPGDPGDPGGDTQPPLVAIATDGSDAGHDGELHGSSHPSSDLRDAHDITKRGEETATVATVTTPSDAQTSTPDLPLCAGPNAKKVDRSQPAVRLTKSYATAIQSGRSSTDRAALATPRMLQGVNRPSDLAKLKRTLEKDWKLTPPEAKTPAESQLREVAIKPSNVHAHDALRSRTQLESEALLAYLRGEIELRHPPNFLKATMPVLQRAIIEQFHEQHIEKTLTARVPPQVRLRKGTKHIALMQLIFSSNTDENNGKDMLNRMMSDIKLLHFDGSHTLKFVFPSRRVAAFYVEATFRLQRGVIELEDSDEPRQNQAPGSFNPAQLRRLYCFRVFGSDAIGLVALTAALTKLAGVTILDVERPRDNEDAIIDNRFVLVHLNQESCPATLQGITRVQVGQTTLTIHHHLVHAREPCKRCYAPLHTTSYCRVKADSLGLVQNRRVKRYTGEVASFDVGSATIYCHTESDSLQLLLDSLTADALQLATVDDNSAPVAELVPIASCNATKSTSCESAGEPKATTRGEKSASIQSDTDDGYKVVLRKSAKKKDSGHSTRQSTSNESKAKQGPTISSAVKTAKTAPANNKAAIGRTTSSFKSTNAASGTAFAKFQRDWSVGQYAALQDDSELESDDSSSHSDEEADYAYTPELGNQDMKMQESMFEQACGARNNSSDKLKSATIPPENNSGNTRPSVPPAQPSVAGSTTPSLTTIQAQPAEQEFSLSLVSQTALTPVQHLSPAISPGLAQRDPFTPLSLATPPAEDGFTIGETKSGKELPQQLPNFLRPFQAHLITVPANGQCAYSALFATTTNASYTIGSPVLRFDSHTVREINSLKKKVYTLMMANLVDDVQAKLVDLRGELRRLYPDQQPPESTEAATAALYAHYAQERSRSVNSQVPASFWASTEVLRAIAQYLREPLYVLDVNAHNDAHVQKYYYKDYILPNGTEHESGCSSIIGDKQAITLLEQCARMHVLPTIMVLKQHENHFYGVGHPADVFLRWNAEGDPKYANTIAREFKWLGEINIIPEGEPALLADMPLTITDADPKVLDAIIRRMPMRKRLDILFTRLNLPVLNDEEYDDRKLELLMNETEAAIYDVTDDISLPHIVGTSFSDLPHLRHSRFQVSTHGRVGPEVYLRLLQSINMNPELTADSGKMRRLIKENHDAVRDWHQTVRGSIHAPHLSDSDTLLLDIFPWLIEHQSALHQLFSYLPYPELAAKELTQQNILRWGEREVYWENIAYFRHVAADCSAPKHARDYCREWAAACGTDGDPTAVIRMAASEDRWSRLRGLLPGIVSPECPQGLSGTHWKLLHVLPHVLWSWSTTPMGRSPRTPRGYYYSQYTGLQKLCGEIEHSNDWGGVAQIPTGATWDERMMEITVVGQSSIQY
ncbi:hypothetical protein PHMEG_00012613 [Phytophthora megakarya]|uniref:OTU domain-containing protein n=1 Tax=Phytophthora megakarya TaxID=4795 RepID=A0A225W8T1_9STRA|nr:hypothetical protein PHMEG_00012613 [Phytophthora megakarya]